MVLSKLKEKKTQRAVPASVTKDSGDSKVELWKSCLGPKV